MRLTIDINRLRDELDSLDAREHIFKHEQCKIRTYGLDIPCLKDCKTIFDQSNPKNRDKQPEVV